MITKNKSIQNNSATIEGTRITVSEIIEAISDGFSIEKILKSCRMAGSNVEKKDIVDAIRFAGKACQ
jgi:uncharacterized protein (DUF433 family)